MEKLPPRPQHPPEAHGDQRGQHQSITREQLSVCTKPGTLLKHQSPIRTFSQWDEQQPGFIEIDLVAHDGGVACGERRSSGSA